MSIFTADVNNLDGGTSEYRVACWRREEIAPSVNTSILSSWWKPARPYTSLPHRSLSDGFTLFSPQLYCDMRYAPLSHLQLEDFVTNLILLDRQTLTPYPASPPHRTTSRQLPHSIVCVPYSVDKHVVTRRMGVEMQLVYCRCPPSCQQISPQYRFTSQGRYGLYGHAVPVLVGHLFNIAMHTLGRLISP